MPSQRRVRVVAVIAAVLLMVLLYTHHSSKQSDREFYDKTVKGMNDRTSVKDGAKAEAKLSVQSFESEQQAQEAAERSRIQGVEEEHRMKEEDMKKKAKAKTASSSKETPNASPVPGAAKKWDMGGEETKPVKKEQTEEEKDVEAELNSILKRSPIIIFSKSYCPFSKKAKAVFQKYTITPAPFIVELDEHKLGSQLQSQLEKLTGRRTVPNVLVSGHSIGGGDDVAFLDVNGELIDKIKTLGGKRIVELALKKA